MYVVVLVGFTPCVPSAWGSLYEVPSEPVIVTAVALVLATVSVEEPPGAMEEGLALMVTVGAGPAVTVTVAVAVAEPPGPVTEAVYVVVFVGLTACVPPLAGKLYELPSEPVTVTALEFVAVTVSIDEAPACTDAGVAEILTVGSGEAVKWPRFSPHPATTMAKRRQKTLRESSPHSDLKRRTAITVNLSSVALPAQLYIELKGPKGQFT